MKSRINKQIALTSGLLAAFTMVLLSFNCVAADKKPGMDQVYTAVEGNLHLYVHEGEQVKKGKPLFYVEANDIFPSKYVTAKHDMINDKLTYHRMVGLFETKAVSQQDVQDAFKTYQEDVDQMDFCVRSIAHGHYYAPFDCTIGKIYYVNGSGIGDGNGVMDIQKA